jgi:hypothetical protein
LDTETDTNATTTTNQKKYSYMNTSYTTNNEVHCAICKTQDNLQIHHLIPLNKGGKDIPENRVTLCKKCHNSRHLSKFNSNRNEILSFKETKGAGAGFYIGPYRREWQLFRELCLREGKSASQLIQKFFVEYLEAHATGNPQQTIEHFFDNDKPFVSVGPCVLCYRNGSYLGERDGKKYRLCSVHAGQFKRSRNTKWKIVGEI